MATRLTVTPPMASQDATKLIVKLHTQLRDAGDTRLTVIVLMDDGSKAVVFIPERDRARLEEKFAKRRGVDVEKVRGSNVVICTERQAVEDGVL